jgi:hypothetical protein
MKTSVLVIAAFILLYGILALGMDRVVWLDGIHEASGDQARFIGLFCIAFSIFIFVSYFRARRRN